jgi:hypothetical protein
MRYDNYMCCGILSGILDIRQKLGYLNTVWTLINSDNYIGH